MNGNHRITFEIINSIYHAEGFQFRASTTKHENLKYVQCNSSSTIIMTPKSEKIY